MEKMKELYEKVAKDASLQAKFAKIMEDAKNAGEEATKKKLVAFAKEAGYDVTIEEIQEYFKSIFEKKDGALSEEELDSVAGGKADLDEFFGRLHDADQAITSFFTGKC